jgi:hypothetical protein
MHFTAHCKPDVCRGGCWGCQLEVLGVRTSLPTGVEHRLHLQQLSNPVHVTHPAATNMYLVILSRHQPLLLLW